jgi:uncharacterized RDD family membrane protein YckC
MATIDSMAGDEPLNNTASGSSAPRYAGFWKRTLALLIDWMIVWSFVSAVSIALVLAVPSVGRFVTLSLPLDIGSVERTIDQNTYETTEPDGSKTIRFEKTTEKTVLDRWVYRFRQEKNERKFYHDDGVFTSYHTTTTRQIDPVTGDPIITARVEYVTLVALLLYWIFADASRRQGSIGKRMLGLKVVGAGGQRLTLAAAAGRNVLKIASAIPVNIGFMMAAWTKRKQALHDKIIGTYVVVG